MINATIGLNSSNDGSEANVRFPLNIVIIYAQYHVYFESAPTGRPLHLMAESTWGYGPVVDRGKKCSVSGRPDYAIWYGVLQETAVNLVVVEAKRRRDTSRGAAQCLGYMGESELPT